MLIDQDLDAMASAASPPSGVVVWPAPVACDMFCFVMRAFVYPYPYASHMSHLLSAGCPSVSSF